jgi:signal transduction histidine kinase
MCPTFGTADRRRDHRCSRPRPAASSNDGRTHAPPEPHDRRLRSGVREATVRQLPRAQTEFSARREDGTEIEVELLEVAVKGERGEITGSLGIHRDVTEREWAETRLEEAREVERSRIARPLHDDALQALADAMVLATAASGASPSGLTSQLVPKPQRVGRQLRGGIYDLRLGTEHKALPLVLEELVAMHREWGG